MITEADIEREQDVEELRRIALAQHAQIQQLIEKLKRKCDTLSFYTGNKEELQQTLALIEGLTKQADQLAEEGEEGRRAQAEKNRRRLRAYAADATAACAGAVRARRR